LDIYETARSCSESTHEDVTPSKGRAIDASLSVDDPAVGGSDKDETGSSGIGIPVEVVADPKEDDGA
jgi:hypothetical protein